MDERTDSERVEQILDTPGLADALESDRFKQFLDHLPVAIAVSQLEPSEVITYANLEFERLCGRTMADIQGRSWKALPGVASAHDDDQRLSHAVETGEQYIGRFTLDREEGKIEVDAWSNLIQDDDGTSLFRLVALGEVVERSTGADELERRLSDKDTLLLEMRHRVKNNLQMITALIRMEARNLSDQETGERFARLAGRINALALLYDLLSTERRDESIDLGVYLSKVASSVMEAHAIEGIRLDMTVDTWPVSINVAMPTGLVVNELLTNALKHAFAGGAGGTIKLHCLVDDTGCRIVISDDGIGLPDGVTWPKAGKLGAMIVQSLKQNAKAQVDVESSPDHGLKVTIFFARDVAARA
jgi:two-component sensor histidine kinase